MKNPNKEKVKAIRQEKRLAANIARQEQRVIKRGVRLEESGKRMKIKAFNQRGKGYIRGKGELTGIKKSTGYKELDANVRITSGRDMQEHPSSYTRIGGVKKTAAKRVYRNAPDLNRPGTGATINRRGMPSRKKVVKVNRPMKRR